MAQTTATIAFVVFVTANLGSVNSELHDTKAELKKACDTATYFRQVSENGHRHLKAALSSVTAAVTKANKLLVLSARNNGNQAQAAQLIASQLLKQIQTTAKTLEQNTADALEGIAAANRISGSQELIAELETTLIADNNVRTLADAVNSQLVKVKPEITANKNGACQKAENQREDLTSGGTRGDGQTLTWSLTALEANTPGTTPNQPLTLCGSNTGDNRAVSAITCDTQTTQIGIKGGNVFKASRVDITRKTTGVNTEYTDLADSTKVPTAKTLNPELKLLRKLEKAAEELEKLSINNDATTLAQQEQIKSVIAKALDGEEGSYSKPETKTKVDAILKELFGDKAENVKTTIDQDLKELKPSKAAVGGNGEKKLETINDPKELADAQIYYTVKNYIADQEEKKKKQAGSSCPTKADKASEPPKSADECKKHNTEKACKDETGCDFDETKDPKCFPKVETDKKDEKSFSRNLRVSVSQEFFVFMSLTQFEDFFSKL
uniref:Variant surface glycoprotein 821 n=1 Tax=Trypanosoma brucei TaxID=5691 RepID=M4SYT1_9TRYP|nr:variant surface glycoprotein 821 [Trypanosoma brucei]